jgi:phosphatidylethanolamine-binding protein (PEBP) family uncharacterized protein
MSRLLLFLASGLIAGALLAAPGDVRKGGKGTGPKAPSAGAADLVDAAKPNEKHPTFRLTSPAVKDGEKLPVEFTGDGDSASPPLVWTGVPRGTQSLVLIMHHLDPEGKTKVYWLTHDIDPLKTSVAKNATDFGRMGISTVHHRVEYAPPHSKGPGEKKYVLTLFALSAKPNLPDAAQPATFEPLLAAMKGKVLAAADLTVLYARPAGGGESEPVRPPRK